MRSARKKFGFNNAMQKHKWYQTFALWCGFAAIFPFAVGLIFHLRPALYQYQCKTRVYRDLEASIDESTRSASIRIVKKFIEHDGDVSSFHYIEGGSGVVFRQEGDTYFVLTAAHVVDECEAAADSDGAARECVLHILPHDELTYPEACEVSNTHIGVTDYYEQFPTARMEYISESCDAAIISFNSGEAFTCIDFADSDVLCGDRIVVFGRSDTSYGKVTSKEYEVFDPHDDLKPDKVLLHTAYIAPGFSGGATLNEELDLVGISIGACTDILDRFKYGAMLPVSTLRSVINDWSGA